MMADLSKALLTVCTMTLLGAGACGPQWQPLFDGQTLDGWRQTGRASWTVEDGVIVGRHGPERIHGNLLTETEYGDFELSVTFKARWPANSGIWFRYDDEKWGYQMDVIEWHDPVCYTGSLYCRGKFFIGLNTDKSLVNRDGWNHALISAVGDHLTVRLNGRKTVDVHDSTFKRGAIGFQVYDEQEGKYENMQIMVKEARIRVFDQE